MSVKNIVAVGASLSPVALLAVLAILGRYFVSPWETPEYGLERTASILAYREPVRNVKLNLRKVTHGDSEALESAVKAWVVPYQEGRLKFIDPICESDDGLSGVREEIESARKALLFGLQRDLAAAMTAHDQKRAAARIHDLLLLAPISKYNSPLATVNGATAQIVAIDAFRNVAFELDEETRAVLGQQVAMAPCDPAMVKKIALRYNTFTRISTMGSEFEEEPAARLTSASTVVGEARSVLMESIRVAYEAEVRLAQSKVQLASLGFKSPPAGQSRLLASSR